MRKKYFFNKIYLYLFSSLFLLIACNKETKKEMQSIDKDTLTIENISKKIRENPTNSLLFSKRASLFLNKKNIEEAINDVNLAIKIDSTNVNFYSQLAEYLLLQGKSGEAKNILEKGLKINNDDVELNFKLGQIHLYVKQYRESMDIFNKIEIIISKNKNVDFEKLAEIFFLKSIILEETGDTAKAVKALQIAVENKPDYYGAYSKLGFLYSKTKKINLSIGYYQKAINIIPKSIEAHYNLGLLYQENNKIKKAIDEYQYIINKIDSTYSYAYFNIGFIKSELENNYKDAIPYFSKAIKYQVTYVTAYYRRGFCFEQLGEFEKARNNYLKSMDILPNYALSVKALNRISGK